MINEELIYVNEKICEKHEAIEFLCYELYKKGYIANKDEFRNAVIERENIISTSVGHGIAIPHGKSSSVKESFVVYLKPSNEFRWDKDEESDVNLIFMIGVPEEGGNKTHLKYISKISKRLIHESFRAQLLKAQNVEETYEILKKIEEE